MCVTNEQNKKHDAGPYALELEPVLRNFDKVSCRSTVMFSNRKLWQSSLAVKTLKSSSAGYRTGIMNERNRSCGTGYDV